MSVPLVSVLIPAFNAAPWISAAAESALTQTWRRLEVIVVDDGSTDDTARITRAIPDPRMKVMTQPNRGASAARNRALAEAHGDYVQFLDADDLLDAAKIEVQLRALQRDPTKVASGAWARFTSDRRQASFRPLYGWRDMTAFEFLYESALERGTFPPIAWLVPRGLCDAAGPWDEHLSMNDDGEYFARVLARSSGIVFCEEAKAYYRSRNPTSYGSRVSLDSARSDMRAWRAIAATILALEDSPRSHRAVATGYQRLQVRYDGLFPAVVDEARRLQRGHGKGAYRFEGGIPFQVARVLLGWRVALRLRRLKAQLRHRSTAAER